MNTQGSKIRTGWFAVLALMLLLVLAPSLRAQSIDIPYLQISAAANDAADQEKPDVLGAS